MRLNWKMLPLAMFVAIALTCAGCSGVNASKSVSPLDFLIPGGGGFLKNNPPTTNAPVAYQATLTEVAVLK